jgi:predicted transcriptional regulator
MSEEKTVQQRYSEWLSSGSVGASAKTIASVMLGRENPSIAYPHDASDYKRCCNLLHFIPEWEDRLGEMSQCPGYHGKIWGELADIWTGLKKLCADGKDADVTAEIKKITVPIEKASGKVGNAGGRISVSTPVSMPAKKSSEESDELEGKAAELIIRENKASTSFVQRHLQIGYNRAVRIIESLEKKGIITAPNEIGKREVTEKGKKSLEVSEKIMDISKNTGQSPEKVLETASKIIDDKKSESDKMIVQEENRVAEEKAAKPELPGIGHNTGDESGAKDVGGVGGQRLLSFI